VGSADSEARQATVDQVEIDQSLERLLQRDGGVKTSLLRPKYKAALASANGFGRKKPSMPRVIVDQ
jgi:hypothetical protein